MPSKILAYILPLFLFNVIWGAVEFFVPVRYSDGNVSLATVGLLFSVISIISVALDIPAGKLSDRIGRERLITISMILAAVALLLLYFSTSLLSLIASALLIGTAYGLNWSPLLAFVSDRIEKNNGGKVFGNFFLISSLGEAVAPLIIVAIVAWSDSRLPFLIFAGIAIICSLIFARLIPKKPKVQPKERSGFSYHTAWKLAKQNLPFNLFLFSLGFFVAFFWQSVWFTQPLIGFYEHTLLDSALIVMVFSLPNILFSNLLGRLVDKIGEKLVFVCSLIIVAAAGLSFYFSTALVAKIIFIFLSAAGILGVWLVLDVLAAKTQKPENRGEFFGILETVRDLSYAVTPALVGFTFAAIGLNGIFIITSALALLLLALGIVILKKRAPTVI